MAEVHEGRDARPIRWLRLVTGVLVAVPVLAGVVVAVLALRTLDRPVDLAVVALAALPAVAAVVVRRRLVWLATALPALRAELRRLADQPDQPPADGRAQDGTGPAVDRREAATTADELDRRLRDHITVRGLWKAVRWLRSPASQAGSTAQQHLGPRAAATVTTTTGAAERVVGLVALAVFAAWGSAALVVAALVLGLTATGGGAPG